MRIRATTLHSTTWVIGTSAASISVSNFSMFFFQGNWGFAMIGLLFAFILPVLVTDSRVDLRGSGACFGWVILALTVFFLGLPTMKSVGWFCLVGTVLLSVILYCVRNKLPKLRTKSKNRIRVSTKTIAVWLYYGIVFFAFATINTIKRTVFTFWSCGTGLTLSLLLFSCAAYYWNWSIEVGENFFTVYRWNKNQTYGFCSICFVRCIPLCGYLLYDESNSIICRVSLAMQGCTPMWMQIRNKIQ